MLWDICIYTCPCGLGKSFKLKQEPLFFKIGIEENDN